MNLEPFDPTKLAVGTVQPGPAVPSIAIDAVADWHRRYRELKVAQESITSMLDEARTKILEQARTQYQDGLPKDLDFTIAGLPVLHVKTVTQNRIDSKRLRKELPQLADAYTVASTQERLTIV